MRIQAKLWRTFHGAAVCLGHFGNEFENRGRCLCAQQLSNKKKQKGSICVLILAKRSLATKNKQPEHSPRRHEEDEKCSSPRNKNFIPGHQMTSLPIFFFKKKKKMAPKRWPSTRNLLSRPVNSAVQQNKNSRRSHFVEILINAIFRQ